MIETLKIAIIISTIIAPTIFFLYLLIDHIRFMRGLKKRGTELDAWLKNNLDELTKNVDVKIKEANDRLNLLSQENVL